MAWCLVKQRDNFIFTALFCTSPSAFRWSGGLHSTNQQCSLRVTPLRKDSLPVWMHRASVTTWRFILCC
jgi:hypothetical protein